ncbi:hypothetical protein Taro_042500 [Colocasia esculenta]|uniref:Uncharacterized protein n=1 Tax=Colocasia esculenta TaxID=4460 RepID=A0A843WWN3_COLES|nr:hypothetical protein [Colocasia esculenta]
MTGYYNAYAKDGIWLVLIGVLLLLLLLAVVVVAHAVGDLVVVDAVVLWQDMAGRGRRSAQSRR